MKTNQPPAFMEPLTPAEQSYFDSILATKGNFTDADMMQAANLARAFVRIDELQSILTADGYILSASGSHVINPAFRQQSIQLKQAMTLSRLLRIDAASINGCAREQVRKSTVKRKALKALDDNDDGLIKRLD